MDLPQRPKQQAVLAVMFCYFSVSSVAPSKTVDMRKSYCKRAIGQPRVCVCVREAWESPAGRHEQGSKLVLDHTCKALGTTPIGPQ